MDPNAPSFYPAGYYMETCFLATLLLQTSTICHAIFETVSHHSWPYHQQDPDPQVDCTQVDDMTTLKPHMPNTPDQHADSSGDKPVASDTGSHAEVQAAATEITCEPEGKDTSSEASANTEVAAASVMASSLPPEALAHLHRAFGELSGIRRSTAMARLRQISTSSAEDLNDLVAGVSEKDFIDFIGVVSRLLDKEWSAPDRDGASDSRQAINKGRSSENERNGPSNLARPMSHDSGKVVHAGGTKRSSRSKSSHHKQRARNSSLRPVKSGSSTKSWTKR